MMHGTMKTKFPERYLILYLSLSRLTSNFHMPQTVLAITPGELSAGRFTSLALTAPDRFVLNVCNVVRFALEALGT
jgi:hypothetical protein